MSHDDAPPAAREAAVASVGLVVLCLVGYGAYLGFEPSNLHNGLIGVSQTAVGLYVLRMRPAHRLAQLLVALGLLSAVMYFGRQYALHDPSLPGAPWLAWISITPVPLSLSLTGVWISMFPTGRPISPRWRTAALVLASLGALLSVPQGIWPIEDDWRSGRLTYPFAAPGFDFADGVIWPFTMVGYQVFQLFWVVSLVVRMRRATGDEIRQLRWFLYAVALVVVLLAASYLLLDSPIVGLWSVPLIPIAAGIAILKYRLYDIDPVINKTLVIGAMLVLITAGYVVVVAGVGALVPVPDGVLSLVATAVVALAFEPVRRRAKRLADRLVYGHRATPYEALSAVSAQLAEASDDLLGCIASTAAKAVGATEVVIWIGTEDRLSPAAGWPATPAAPLPLAALGGYRVHVRPVRREGEVRGAITVRKAAGDTLHAAEDRLLADLGAQAGLVIDHQAQEQELRAAARRIVSAGDAARRRIERDLHDGAQQRLVTLGIELGALVDRVRATGDSALTAEVAQARERLLEATGQLRDLARGLHPQVLSQDGLAAALEHLADVAPLPVRLEVRVIDRLTAATEATAYFLVSEAITNAARHACAGSISVELARDTGGLRVEVADDGCGGACASPGGGLQGLSDRLAALGARLDIESPPGGGTRLWTVIPCE